MTSKTTDQTLKHFSFIFLAYFTGASLFLYSIGWLELSYWLILIPLILMTSRIIWPQFLFPLYWVWNRILQCLAFVNTRILLGSIFFFIFTPVAILRRVLKKDTLHLNQENVQSYRIKVTNENDLRKPY